MNRDLLDARIRLWANRALQVMICYFAWATLVAQDLGHIASLMLIALIVFGCYLLGGLAREQRDLIRALKSQPDKSVDE